MEFNAEALDRQHTRSACLTGFTKVGGLIAAGSHGDVTARAAFTIENGQRLADC